MAGDSALIKGRRLKVNRQKKTIAPEAVLYTRNVMIPVIKPVPLKQSCNIPLSENRHQVHRAQNYRNNPEQLFSEAPLRTLYDSLKSEVDEIGHWQSKNQLNTQYTVFGKTNSSDVEKSSISKKLSRKKRNNTLHFPNTVSEPLIDESEPLIDEICKDLHKPSSRSIKLLRKWDLSQLKKRQTKDEGIYTLLPKIEAPVSNVMNKPVVSLPSQSFYNIIDAIPKVSTQSKSSFKIGSKKTFANIVDKKKLICSVASNHFQPNNSEYEINILHYENDIPSGDNFPQFTQSHLKSATNRSSARICSLAKIQNDNENLVNERHTGRDKDKTADEIKCSREIDDWMPSQRKEHENIHKIKITKRNDKSPYDCKIKYSWQVIGISTQTSYTLLQDLLNSIDIEENKSSYKMCSIKYSWQIIGIGTQASLQDYNDPDYWSGILLTPNKNYNENEVQIKGRLNKYLLLNNQQTQTFAEKEVQADPNDCYAKYSWHNLIKQYL